MASAAGPPGAPGSRATRSISHATAAWSALSFMVLITMSLVFVLVTRVTFCRLLPEAVGLESSHLFYSVCNFNAAGWVGLAIGFAIVATLGLLLAAYELDKTETPRAELWKRPHYLPVQAYRALRRRDTPHRRKSIAAIALFLLLVVGFYALVAFMHIAFQANFNAAPH